MRGINQERFRVVLMFWGRLNSPPPLTVIDSEKSSEGSIPVPCLPQTVDKGECSKDVSVSR